MTNRIFTLILILGYFRLAGGWESMTDVQAQSRILHTAIGQNLIVAAEGHVNVKRNGWSNYAPAMFGGDMRCVSERCWPRLPVGHLPRQDR